MQGKHQPANTESGETGTRGHMPDLVGRLRTHGFYAPPCDGCLEAADEIERLRGLLVEANDAFDECTGDYPKGLCADEPWREFRSES